MRTKIAISFESSRINKLLELTKLKSIYELLNQAVNLLEKCLNKCKENPNIEIGYYNNETDTFTRIGMEGFNIVEDNPSKDSVTVINNLEDIVKVNKSNLSIYTNGSGELFIKTKSKTYRLKEGEFGYLQISANEFSIKNYGASSGLLIK